MDERWQVAEQTRGDTLPTGSAEAAVRPPLTYGRIIRTAITLIEREGVQALSMRRIGGELGVAAMSLYNHVPSKEAMLDGVADEILSGLELDADPGADWRDRVRDLAHAFHRTAHAHPRSMSVVLSRSMDWTRSLPVIEQMLTIAEQAGFAQETAVRVMRTFMSYVMGTLMREEGTTSTLRHIAMDGGRAAESVDPAAFPHVVEAARELLNPDFDADFDFGLELLIAAIERLPRTTG
jgi:AcrR family transcriptional regulator